MAAVPNEIGERALIRALGDTFEAQGWDDRESLALEISEQARKLGGLDPAAASGLASSAYLTRNQIDRADLESAIAEVFAGRQLLPPERDYPAGISLVTTFEVQGDGNTFGDVNLGNQKVRIDAGSPKEDFLAAMRHLLVDGLSSGISIEKLGMLDRLSEERNDLSAEELEAVARDAITDAAPEPGQLQQLRNAVMTGTASGVLVQAIVAVASVILG